MGGLFWGTCSVRFIHSPHKKFTYMQAAGRAKATATPEAARGDAASHHASHGPRCPERASESDMPAEHGIARLLQEVRPHAVSMCAGVFCLAVATLGELAIMRACGTAVDLLTTAAPASEGAIDAAVGWLMAMFGVVAVFKHLGE